MTQRRFGNFQVFARGVSKDDGRYDGLQQGVITYDENDNYQVSYIELGLRCDHIGEKISPVTSSRIATSDPLDCDADLMIAKSVAPSVSEKLDAQTRKDIDKSMPTSSSQEKEAVFNDIKSAENGVVPTTVTV